MARLVGDRRDMTVWLIFSWQSADRSGLYSQVRSLETAFLFSYLLTWKMLPFGFGLSPNCGSVVEVGHVMGGYHPWATVCLQKTYICS